LVCCTKKNLATLCLENARFESVSMSVGCWFEPKAECGSEEAFPEGQGWSLLWINKWPIFALGRNNKNFAADVCSSVVQLVRAWKKSSDVLTKKKLDLDPQERNPPRDAGDRSLGIYWLSLLNPGRKTDLNKGHRDSQELARVPTLVRHRMINKLPLIEANHQSFQNFPI
jgi:hypothetical protein